MTGFFHEPVGQLPVDALFNATIQLLPFPIQADDQRGKRPFGKAVLGLERGHRDAGEMMDLQGSDDFRGVTRMQSSRGDRINRCQTGIQMLVPSVHAPPRRTATEFADRSVALRTALVRGSGHRGPCHPRPTAAVAVDEALRSLRGMLPEETGIERFIRIDQIDEVMDDPCRAAADGLSVPTSIPR